MAMPATEAFLASPEPTGLSEREIKQIARTAIEEGRQWNEQFEGDRVRAMNYYLAKPFGNERDGRSKTVLTDVADTIEWYIPTLLKVFTSGSNVISFQPVSGDDEEKADQENKYCHHVFWHQNDGFNLLYDWFKNGLVLKTGIMKVWWAEEDRADLERYKALTELELRQLQADEQVEILDADPIRYIINHPDTGDPIAENRYNVRLRRWTQRDRVRCKNVDPEMLFVSPYLDTLDLDDADFVVHRWSATRSHLIEMGFDTDTVMTLEPAYLSKDIDAHRHRGGRRAQTGGVSRETQMTNDPTMVRVWVDECYIRMDIDDDGVAELVQVFMSGETLLDWEEWGGTQPFVAICPIPMPNEFYGRSLADQMLTMQYTRSQVIRSMEDNMFRTNNQRWEVPDAIMGAYTLDDLLTDTPGGVIRTEGAGGIRPLPTDVTWQHGAAVLAFLGEEGSRRVGLNAFNMGMVPDTAESGRTAAGSAAFRKAANQRIDTVARIYAEGLKRVYLKIHENLRRYQDTDTVLKISGTYVPVNPSNWRDRTEAVARIGMGAMDVDQQMSALTSQLQLLLTYSQHPNPVVQGMAQPENIYKLNKEILEVSTILAPERFLTSAEESAQQVQQFQEQAAQQQQQQMQQQLQMQQTMMQMQAQLDVMLEQAKEQAKSQSELMRIEAQTASDMKEADQDHRHTLIEDAQKIDAEKQIVAFKEGAKAFAGAGSDGSK